MERVLTVPKIFFIHFPCSALILIFLWALLSGEVMGSEGRGAEHGAERAISQFASVDAKGRLVAIEELYNDLFLAAYNNAPEVEIARREREQKQAERYTAMGKRFIPSLEGRLSHVHELNYQSSESTSDTIEEAYSDDRDYTDWGIRFNLPLFNKGLSVSRNIARAEEVLANNTLLIKTQELDLRLRELLGNDRTSTYRLFNIRNSVTLSKEHVARIHRGFELRDQTKLQLLRAQANLTDLEARRDLDEQAQEVSLRELLDFSGLEKTDPTLLTLESLLQDEMSIGACIHTLSAIEENYPRVQEFVEEKESAELLTYFPENSLMYKKLFLDKELADQKAQAFTKGEWFDVSLQGEYDRREDSDFSEYDGEGTLSLVLSVPLITGGTLFSNAKNRAMAERVADINKVTEEKFRFHAIENSRKLIDSLLKVRQEQQLNLEQQEEIVILSSRSYQIKQTSMQDLLTSQNRLIDAKNALVDTTNRLGTLLRQFPGIWASLFFRPRLMAWTKTSLPLHHGMMIAWSS